MRYEVDDWFFELSGEAHYSSPYFCFNAFVKCVAIHTGLGFDLWLKEENHNEPFIPETLKKRASAAKIKTIKQICTSHGVDGDAWVAGNGKTWEEWFVVVLFFQPQIDRKSTRLSESLGYNRY